MFPGKRANWAVAREGKVGKAGKTADEKQKGRECNEEVVPFGEMVMYKRLKGSGERKKVMEIQSWNNTIKRYHRGYQIFGGCKVLGETMLLC